jgi:UDPglucose 6-dehydrogenase
MPKVSILGSGFVGTVVGEGLSKLGNAVIFYDVNEQRVRNLCDLGFTATTSIAQAVDDSTFSFICVPTPNKNMKIDLSYIRSVVSDLSVCLKHKKEYHTVVMKSTVVPTTTRMQVLPLLEKISGKKVGKQLGLCVNPEFLTEISGSWTDEKSFERKFFNENRIVIGEFDKKSGETLESLYMTLEVPRIRVDLETAEMIKYASNCALATRISYWNEIFYICKRLGIDSRVVAEAAVQDPRIGKYGSIHGRAFGGKCLPKDLRAFIRFSEDLGYKPRLLKATEEINDRIRDEIGVRE